MNILILNSMFIGGADHVKYRPRQPLCLLYLVSILRREFGFRVVFRDLNCRPMVDLDLGEFDCLITTSTPLDRWETPQFDFAPALRLITEVKMRNSRILTILAGTHGTVTPCLMFDRCPELDIVVRGEPENVLRDYFSRARIQDVMGISYRDQGSYVHNPGSREPVDLDSLPLPAYDEIDFNDYHHTYDLLSAPFTIVESSRGCPHQCIYCCKVMFGERYRSREPARVYEELLLLKRQFGVRSVYFQDLEFTINKERVRRLCRLMIENDLRMSWGCCSRCDDVDEELLMLMKQAGCVLIAFGVESLSDRILRGIRKGVTYSDIKRTRKLCRRVGIKFVSFTAVGFPGESRGSILTSMIRSILAGVDYSPFGSKIRPYPGTKLWDMAIEQEAALREGNPWAATRSLAGKVGNDSAYLDGRMFRYLLRLMGSVQKIRRMVANSL